LLNGKQPVRKPLETNPIGLAWASEEPDYLGGTQQGILAEMAFKESSEASLKEVVVVVDLGSE
jgi:hypothetical protein